MKKMIEYFLIYVCLLVYVQKLMHYRKNETIYNVNNKLTNLLYKKEYPIVSFIPRDIEPLEFELFFH